MVRSNLGEMAAILKMTSLQKNSVLKDFNFHFILQDTLLGSYNQKISDVAFFLEFGHLKLTVVSVQ